MNLLLTLFIGFILHSGEQSGSGTDTITWPDGFEVGHQQAFEAIESGRFDEAIVLYESALRMIEDLTHPQALHTRALMYNNLADAYSMVGRINISIDTFIKAYDIWTSHFPDSSAYIITILNNMVFMMVDYGDVRAAHHYAAEMEMYTQSALQNLLTEKPERIRAQVMNLYTQVKATSLQRDTLAMAKHLEHMQEVLAAYSRSELEPYDAFLISIYESIGYMYVDMKEYSRSMDFYKRMLEFPLNDFFEMKYHANTAVALHRLGRHSQALHHTEEALRYFELNQFGLGFLTLNVLKADILMMIARSGESRERIEFIFSELLGRPLTVEDLPGLTYSDFNGLNSSRHINLLTHAARILSHTETSPDASINLYRLATDMFDEYYRKEAYNPYLEELQRKTENGLLALMLGRPQEELADVVNRLENNKNLQFWNAFLSKNERYLGESGPALRQDFQMDVDRIRMSLGSNDLIVRYYASYEEVFALTIATQGLNLYRIGDHSQIRDAAVRFHTSVASRSRDYVSLADSLHQLLIAPLNLSDGIRLSIIPDGMMSYIPFEILSDDRGYLLERHPIRYGYSLRFNAFTYQPVHHRRFLAAYAPDYHLTPYADIQNSITEATSIARQLRGSLYTGAEALKSNFIRQSHVYAIHHLAMHAVQDPYNFEHSSLIFAGGERLPFYEIHTMYLPAEMVVLSACETGIGALEPGEGLMGLARALAYSGVRSSVYSLWQVPDRATASIMTAFYTNLKEGLPRDESLRQAKLQFLNDEPLMAHPYFWAGFVLNGNYEPLTRPWYAGIRSTLGKMWNIGGHAKDTGSGLTLTYAQRLSGVLLLGIVFWVALVLIRHIRN